MLPTILILGLVGVSTSTSAVETPDGYRMDRYRSPVPLEAPGATTLDSPEALRSLLEREPSAVLLDVYPAAPRPPGLPKSELWFEPRRETLPGALWLPNVGYGAPTDELLRLLLSRVNEATSADRARPVVVFCEPSCWHSWNAAKRLAAAGYREIYWYRQGVLGWSSAGFSTETTRPIRPPEPLALRRVADGVHVFQGAIEDVLASKDGRVANLAVIIGERGVAVIDSGAQLPEGRALEAAIRTLTELPIRYLINTHVHLDHVFGNPALMGPQSELVAHHGYPAALGAKGAHYQGRLEEQGFEVSPLPLPSVLVEGTKRLDLGDRILELRALPSAHTDHDLVVIDLATQTLIAGDILFVEHCPVVDGSLLGWLRVLEELERVPFKHIIPGHGPVLEGWRGAEPLRRYLKGLRDATRAAVAAQMGMAKASETLLVEEAAQWKLCEEFHRRNVISAYAELEWE